MRLPAPRALSPREAMPRDDYDDAEALTGGGPIARPRDRPVRPEVTVSQTPDLSQPRSPDAGVPPEDPHPYLKGGPLHMCKAGSGDIPSRGGGRVTASQTSDSQSYLPKGSASASKLRLLMRYSATPMGVSTHNVYAPLPTSKGYTGDNPSRGDGRVTASQTLDSRPLLLKGLVHGSELAPPLLPPTVVRPATPWVAGGPESWSRGF